MSAGARPHLSAAPPLHELVQLAVREERLRDRLTGLGSHEALREWIQQRTSTPAPFWLAFVEVDRFKSVNELHGYAAGDELLRQVGAQLGLLVGGELAADTAAFRVHGDEFFLGGSGTGTHLHATLQRLRRHIAALRVHPSDAAGPSRPMHCTVSIGFVTSGELHASGVPISEHHVMAALEAAVADAKLERDCVVRFDGEHKRTSGRSGRADCPGCQCRFEVRVATDQVRADLLYCPNCGSRVPRPPGLTP